MKIILWHSCQGSPPRRRGKDFMFCGQHLEIRITPAWAGKSTCRTSMPTVSWDHPRVGGEKQKKPYQMTRRLGSPPRGRGKGVVAPQPPAVLGITPAQAGKSYRKERKWSLYEDHPRTGGEKDIAPVSPIGVSGSPPRRRGKVRCSVQLDVCHGITPAWAGKS